MVSHLNVQSLFEEEREKYTHATSREVLQGALMALYKWQGYKEVSSVILLTVRIERIKEHIRKDFETGFRR